MGHNQPHYGVRRWLAAERVDEFDDTCGLLLVMLDTLLCFGMQATGSADFVDCASSGSCACRPKRGGSQLKEKTNCYGKGDTTKRRTHL